MRREPTLADHVSSQMPKHQLASIQAIEAEAWAREERDKLQAEYLKLELELRAAIDIRLEEIERLLSPKDASAEELMTAARASEETLNAAMDVALDCNLEDQALLCFKAARTRDLEGSIAHACSVREDWALLYGELLEASRYPNLDDRELKAKFETIATPAPTQAELRNGLLTQETSALNAYGSMF